MNAQHLKLQYRNITVRNGHKMISSTLTINETEEAVLQQFAMLFLLIKIISTIILTKVFIILRNTKKYFQKLVYGILEKFVEYSN